MDNRPRVPISVSVHPSDYAGRTVRLGSGNSDIREKMNARMREFELESQKWREQFLSGSSLTGQPPLLENRPRLAMNFPEFPELSHGFGSPQGRQFGAPALALAQNTSHKSFIEEDDNGHKKYKMVLLDRLGYTNNPAITNSSTSSTSTMRNSPFRDVDSPSRLAGSSLLSSPFSREPFIGRDPLLSGFNTPFFTDMNFSQPMGTSSMSSQQQQQHQKQAAPQQQLTHSNAASYKFNMSEFRPEDISITVTDTTLKIHALREENEGGHGKTYRK